MSQEAPCITPADHPIYTSSCPFGSSMQHFGEQVSKKGTLIFKGFLGVSGSAPVDLMSMDGGLTHLVPVPPLAFVLLVVTHGDSSSEAQKKHKLRT